MQITKIEMVNYRSHKHTVMDGIGQSVVIKGANQSGKSNIYHALNMVLSNGPWPEEDLFIDKKTKTRAKDGLVEITFSNGTKIKRTRTKTKNGLVLTDAQGNERQLGTIQGADSIVAEFTGFYPVNLFRDDTKDKGQILQMVPLENTTPFLLVGTSPENVLRALNRLTAGASFETAIGNTKRFIAKLSDEVDWYRSQSEHFKELVGAFDEKEYQRLEAQLKDAQALEDKIEVNESTFLSVQTVLSALEALPEPPNSLDYLVLAVTESDNLERQIQGWKEKDSQLQDIITQLDTLDKDNGQLMYTIDVVDIELKTASSNLVCGECGRPME